MKLPKAERERLRAEFENALRQFQAEFPLEQRLSNAAPEVQRAYAQVLRHWLTDKAPPQPELISPSLLQALIGLDAVVASEEGIACYPFSARDTGIHVRFAEQSVHAMCTLDALAIPRLIHSACCVVARCAVCRCHLTVCLEAQGSLPHDGKSEGIRVLWHPRSETAGSCCDTLCPKIRFLCRHCGLPAGAISLSLPQAAALASRFFAFQQRLLKKYFPPNPGRARVQAAQPGREKIFP